VTLSITATSIPSLDWVGKLSHLTGLALNNERLESLDLAATLVSLTSLQATGNPRVKSVAPLAKLEHPTLL
jgi:hypothetical protein